MRIMLATLAALAMAVPAIAQSAPSQNPFSDSLRSQWRSVRTYYQKSAEQMSEENYSFRPTDQVRTFGEIIAHVAGANYGICSAAKGETSQYTEDYFVEHAKTKAEIVKAANDSIAYCDQAFAAATDRSLSEMVPNPFDPKAQIPRGAVLVENIGHVNEHYGNLVTYMRIKGMVPPSSQTSGR